VSALTLPWGGSKRGGKKAKSKKRAAKLPAEYNMLLTATLCLLAFGAVMVFSASSTTRILNDGGLSDSAFYLKRTLLFGAVGLGIMHLAARHGLSTVRRLTSSSSAAARSTGRAAGSAPASSSSSPRSSPRWR